MMFALSERAQDFIARTQAFIQQEIEPIEKAFWDEVHQLNVDGDWTKWQWPAQLEQLKTKAKAAAYGICSCLILNWVQVYRYRNMHILLN